VASSSNRRNKKQTEGKRSLEGTEEDEPKPATAPSLSPLDPTIEAVPGVLAALAAVWQDCVADILPHICSFLDIKTVLTRFSLVNKAWNTAGKDPLAWDTLDLSPYNLNEYMMNDIFTRDATRRWGKVTTICLDECHLALTNSLVLDFCPLLEKLSLRRCSGVDDSTLCLGLGWVSSPELQSLNLSFTAITDESLWYLAHLPKLTMLNISWCNVTDSGIACLRTLALRHLDITGCDKLTNTAIMHLAASHGERLVGLHAGSCHLLSARALSHLAESCTHLEELNFCDTKLDFDFNCPPLWRQLMTNNSFTSLNFRGTRVTDECLKAVAAHCHSSLKLLNIAYCEHITSQGIAALSCCTLLESINFAGLSKASTDGCLSQIFSACNSLAKVNLKLCQHLTDQVLQALGAHCPLLESLIVTQVGSMTDKGVLYLAEGCPHLKRVDLDRTRVTVVGLQSLLASAPGLQIRF